MEKKNKKWDYTFEIRKRILPGSYILSEPYMADPSFKRSVCLICDHNKKDGTFGFIINKPLDRKIGFFVDELQELDIPVYYGGPVSNDSLYYIHMNESNLEGAQQVGKKLYWGGNFEQMKAAIQNDEIGLDNVRFFLGYSGWDSGQLRKEIIENSWIVYPEKDASFVFEDHQTLWQDMMKNMGSMYKEMAMFPEHPSLN